MNAHEYRTYRVWDAPTRWFHWINVLSVLGLIGVGLVILFNKELGISLDGKITLKTIHVIIGYVFVLNLLGRVVWGFFGNAHSRWRAVLPGGPGYLRAVRAYVAAFVKGHPQVYIGHNPLGRLAVTVIFLLLVVLAVTGLVRAGTDLYYPPFGVFAASFVAKPGADPGDLVPEDTTLVDAGRYDRLKAFRRPFGVVHTWCAYLLMGMIVLHVGAVVVTELREGGGLVSAMFTGRKVLAGKVVDDVEEEK
jgi:Ni/Fe-hydrogenase 1 B-type cytochrome subunit